MITHKIIKYIPPPVRQGAVFPFAPPHIPITEEALKAHLLHFPYQVGDWLVYRAARTNGLMDSGKAAVVVRIETDHTKVRGDRGTPKPFLLMQLSGTAPLCRAPDYKYSPDPWCRFDDGGGMELVSAEERIALNDDFVQNYIQKYLPRAEALVR